MIIRNLFMIILEISMSINQAHVFSILLTLYFDEPN